MRYLIDDPAKSDPRALLTAAKMAAVANAVPPEPDYIWATGTDTLTVAGGYIFAVGGSVFKTQTTVIGAGHLDAGTAFTAGSTYYVYLCDTGADMEEYKISLSAAAPSGFNAENSRKIGRFEFTGAGVSLGSVAPALDSSGKLRLNQLPNVFYWTRFSVSEVGDGYFCIAAPYAEVTSVISPGCVLAIDEEALAVDGIEASASDRTLVFYHKHS